MNAQLQRYQQEADEITKQNQTPQTRARLQFLISAMSIMKREFNDTAVSDREEARNARAEKAFEAYLRSADSSEIRTYSPETTSTASVLIPNQWAGKYLDRLKAFVGIRQAGADLLTTKVGGPWKYPFSDDTANNGERLNETDPVTLANPTFSLNTLNTFRYTGKGVQVSNELVDDIGFDLSGYLQDMFAKRVGRITNTEFTNGASGGPTGVLPSITNVQNAVAATSVTVADLVSAQNIDAGYLDGAVYMFSPGVERVLKAMVATASGLRIFPEMKDKMLLGYPYALNTAMPASFTANAQAVAFGNFKRGVLIRDVAPLLVVSNERFGEFGMTYYSLTHRQDCVVTDANALAVLQQAAS
jgi:HK97 family phage major capsid protein